jgi:hypothetical protein
MQANNTDTIIAALTNTTNVNCSPDGFHNFSITMKQLEPQAVPQTATLTLYSLSDTSFYKYDLTPQLSNTSTIGQWNNLTITLGPNATGWTITGAPTWSNITSLTLEFTYPSNSDITIRIGALFFHGEYLTPVQYNSTGILLQFLQLFSLQFIFAWFILTGLIYVLCRYLLKGAVLWKPLFTAIAFAMMIMVVRALVNLVATFALPAVYYPFDLSLGVRFDPYAALYFPPEALGTLPAMSHTIFNNIDAATLPFRTIVSGMFIVSYVWLGGVVALALGALKPEFSMIKRVAITALSLVIVVLLLIFLVGAV